MQCLMRSDGTSLIKDAVHNLAATLAGTPTTATLLGVTAPVIGAAAYTNVSYPTASLGIAPGMPISIICVVNKTPAWNDGNIHLMYMNIIGTGPPLWETEGYELLQYASVVLINSWHGTGSKNTAIAVDSTNWSANTKHVVIATLDAANNQRIFIDGTEGFAVTGSCSRETSVGPDSYIGIHNDGNFPLEGAQLTAIYSGLLTDGMIFDIGAMTNWSDLEGIVNPPSPPTPSPLAVAPAPSTPPRQQTGAHIIIQNMAGTSTISELSEQMPDQQPAINLFEGLSLESCNPGGFTVANFTLHRPVTQSWPDLGHRNRVIIGQGAQVWWEGWIDKPVRKIRPDTFDVGCLGWSARLNQLWATADITAGAGGYLMSTFITAMLADAGLSTNSEVVAGTVAVTDYAYPVGTQFQFAPATPYFDALTTLNAGNGYNWGVWLDHKFYFTAATPTVIQWYAKTSDCEDITITPNPEALCNYALINFTQDGSHYEQVIVQDAVSIALYGLIKIITTDATQIANLYLAACKDLHVAAEFTTRRIYDIWGAEHHLAEVRGGDNVRVLDWLPTEDTLSGVNDIATFQIKAAKYDHGNYTLAITPTEFVPRTDILIARLQATGY